MRALIMLAVVNTILFTGAMLAGLSIWWIVGAECGAFVVWIAGKAWFHPAQQLANQAAHMHWTAAGIERDENGFRDALLVKDGVVARISYQRRDVYIVEPIPAGPFRDFVELDRFLQQNRRLFGLS